MLKVFQSDTRYNDLDDWRFSEMAAPLGGKGVRVASRAELAAALAAAHADETSWHLIEIMIPRGEYSRTLDQFVGAVRRRSVMGKG